MASPTSWMNAPTTRTTGVFGVSTTVEPGSVGSVDVVEVVVLVAAMGPTVVVEADVVGRAPVVDVGGATVVEMVMDVVGAGSATGSGPADPQANPMHARAVAAIEIVRLRTCGTL